MQGNHLGHLVIVFWKVQTIIVVPEIVSLYGYRELNVSDINLLLIMQSPAGRNAIPPVVSMYDREAVKSAASLKELLKL